MTVDQLRERLKYLEANMEIYVGPIGSRDPVLDVEIVEHRWGPALYLHHEA